MSLTDSQKSLPQSSIPRCWAYGPDEKRRVRRCRNAAFLTFLVGAKDNPEHVQALRALKGFEALPGESVRERMNRFADMLPTCSPYLEGSEFAAVSLCREHVMRDLENEKIAEHAGEFWTLGLTRDEILDELDRRAFAEWAEAHREEGFIVRKWPGGTVWVKHRVH